MVLSSIHHCPVRPLLRCWTSMQVSCLVQLHRSQWCCTLPLGKWLLHVIWWDASFLCFVYFQCKKHFFKIFFPMVTMRSYIDTWASGLSLIERKNCPLTCPNANMNGFWCWVSGRKLLSNLFHINEFFFYIVMKG